MKRIERLEKLPSTTVYSEMDSPVGQLTILASSQGLHCILWDCESATKACREALSRFKKFSNHNIILKTKAQLTEYFSGKRKDFQLPLAHEGTPFQIQAWEALCKIPYAKTVSYGEQAKKIGDKNKARAVGLANALNPISIIIPCHRVIGSHGQLTGFAGGLDRKALLLQLEKRSL